ncbi:hypothetical protein [Homoserinibacter sp. GY 40078]|uniref:hypothetical protein n=1 Tax=Homoserinibacter sp. GY 40078 TaxID=2603275 RepID=UPI0011CC511A|nr:hypothetical protein [Homoserinibacter sp. GY 40078]TXK19374.1 hypothetical protein FVQ89_05565 [Homoserinibacter sp. GY 40078]
MLLFTTGTFTSGADQLLEKPGLVSMNGEQLAAFLADAGVGIDANTVEFDAAQFKVELDVNAPNPRAAE